MKSLLRITCFVLFFSNVTQAARLSMGVESAGQSNAFRIDILWTMGLTDEANTDLDGLDARFNVGYPAPGGGQLIVTGVVSPIGWNTSVTEGVGGAFSELDFFLSAADASGEGISGNGSHFTTVVASIFLQGEGNVAGTEITFRHHDPLDPLPAPYDGPRDWQLRWQYEVTGPLQFDIGVGNPGDEGGVWTYHGYETYEPLVIVPEPGPLAVIALAALALLGSRSRAP
jgi:hypothetical protein